MVLIDNIRLKIGGKTLSVIYSTIGGLVLIAFWLYVSQVKPIEQTPPANIAIVKDIAYTDNEDTEVVEMDDDNTGKLLPLPQPATPSQNQNTSKLTRAIAAISSLTAPSQYKDGSYSATSATPWGDLTVSVTVSNGKWTDVVPVQTPDSPPSIYAVTYLARQALTAQNQNINGVSGATFVSNAFRDDLSQIIKQSKN